MSSLIKTFNNNSIYHDFINEDNSMFTHNSIISVTANTLTTKKTKNNTKPSNKSNETNTHVEPIYNNVRFTKVLTKYSTEYNNYNFIHNLCQQLGMDKKDLFAFFVNFKSKYNNDNECFTELLNLFENYEINKLDIQRMYRYLDKSFKDSNLADEETAWEMNEDIDDME
jgi:hypothetical protein